MWKVSKMPEEINNLSVSPSVKEGLNRFREDSQFLDHNHEKFVKKYPDQWVAAYNKKIVGVNSDFETLLDELRQKGISPGETAIELMTTEKVTWILFVSCK